MSSVFDRELAELDEIQGIDFMGEPVRKLRIVPAEEPATPREAVTFWSLLGVAWCLLVLAGMKAIELYWRVAR